MHRSTSWVTKVERGVRRVDSVTTLLELSRVLGVELHQLTGKSDPVATSAGPMNGDLRRVLDRPASIGFTLSDSDASSQPADLLLEAKTLRRWHNSGRSFSTIAPLLARLIEETQQTVASVTQPHQRATAYEALSAFYRLASVELRQQGEVARARLAIDRALHAAESSGDELLVASVAATLTVQLMIQGDPEDGVALALEAAQALNQRQELDRTRQVVNGALHLYAAQAAARAGDGGEARRLLALAADIAEEAADDNERHFLIFGPTNVAIQKAGILVDLQRPAEAIQAASTVRVERVGSVNRSGYHYLHLARANGMTGDDSAAIEALTAARRVAPGLVSHDPLARDQVRHLLHIRRRVDEQLRRLARDMGVLG